MGPQVGPSQLGPPTERHSQFATPSLPAELGLSFCRYPPESDPGCRQRVPLAKCPIVPLSAQACNRSRRMSAANSGVSDNLCGIKYLRCGKRLDTAGRYVLVRPEPSNEDAFGTI